MRHKLDRELKNRVFAHLVEFNEIRDTLSELMQEIDAKREEINVFTSDPYAAIKATETLESLKEKVQGELSRLEVTRGKSNQTLNELETRYGKGHIDLLDPEYYETND